LAKRTKTRGKGAGVRAGGKQKSANPRGRELLKDGGKKQKTST